jgi:hypothetical protein
LWTGSEWQRPSNAQVELQKLLADRFDLFRITKPLLAQVRSIAGDQHLRRTFVSESVDIRLADCPVGRLGKPSALIVARRPSSVLHEPDHRVPLK